MSKYFFFAAFSFLLLSCGDTTPAATTEEAPVVEKPKTKDEIFAEVKAELASKPSDFEGMETLPSIGLEVLENLWENCDFVDYVYYELPISASLDKQGSIRTAISHIEETPVAKLPGCKAIGRVFYQIEGENVLQGDIFFTKGCTYFLWVDKKGKYFAGNLMMDSAIQFFASNIQAAQGNITPQN